MQGVNKHLDVLWIHVGVDSVAKVGNPALPAEALTQTSSCSGYLLPGRVEGTGIQVSLQRDLVSNDRPVWKKPITFRWHFSITVQRNDMRFGGIVAPNSGCLSLTLGPCSSFGFGVVSVLLSRFHSLFKCTVNK